MEATPEDMSICPGIGEQKVINILNKKKGVLLIFCIYLGKENTRCF